MSFYLFIQRACPSFNGSTCYPYLLGMLSPKCYCICHLFPMKWSPYSSSCSGTYRNQHFSLPTSIIIYPNFITPVCLFLSPPFKSHVVQSYLHWQAYLINCLQEEFSTLLVDVPLNFTRTHLWSYVSSIMSIWLLTSFTTLTFCLSLVHFLTMLHIHLKWPHPMFTHFSHC